LTNAPATLRASFERHRAAACCAVLCCAVLQVTALRDARLPPIAKLQTVNGDAPGVLLHMPAGTDMQVRSGRGGGGVRQQRRTCRCD